MKPILLLKIYVWLFSTIRREGYITRDRLNDLWMKETKLSDGIPMERAQFNRYRCNIQDLFDVNIECDEHYNYYIDAKELDKADEILRLLTEVLYKYHDSVDYHKIKDRIFLEPNPSAGYFLKELIDSMCDDKIVRIKYKRYENKEAATHVVKSYFLKQYHQRWYLYGAKDDDKMLTFSLDRIQGMKATDKKFVFDNKLNVEDYFKDAFGVVVDERVPVERIVIRAFGTEANYLRDLKLHHSQKEIFTSDEYCDFELRLRPTLDFVGKLCERAYRLKVLEPDHLAAQLRDFHLRSVKLYE